MAEKVRKYLIKNQILFFKAKHIYPIFQNDLPNQHINDLCKILMILHDTGTIKKWSNRTWIVTNKRNTNKRNE